METMGYVIDIKDGMTPRELIRELEHGFKEFIDIPLSCVETIHEDCNDCDNRDVTRIKIKMSDGLELRIYSK